MKNAPPATGEKTPDPKAKGKKSEKELAAEKAAAAKTPPAAKPVVKAKKPGVVTKPPQPVEKPAKAAAKEKPVPAKAKTAAAKEKPEPPKEKAEPAKDSAAAAKTPAKTPPKFRPGEVKPLDPAPAKPSDGKVADAKPGEGAAVPPPMKAPEEVVKPPLPDKLVGPVPAVPAPLPGSPAPGIIEPAPATPGLFEVFPETELPTPFGKVILSRIAYTPKPAEQRVYTIGKFVIKYGTDVIAKNKKLPPPEKLGDGSVLLAQEGEIYYHIPRLPSKDSRKSGADPAYLARAQGAKKPRPEEKKEVAAAPNAKKGAKEEAKKPAPPKAAPLLPAGVEVVSFVPSAGAKPRKVSAHALIDIYDSIVQQLNDRGVVGVYLMTNLDPRAGEAGWINGTDIEVQVFISEVAKIRTIARRIPFRLSEGSMINDEDAPDGEPVKDKKHLWIKDKSTIKPGELVEKKKLQNYLSRLNRFPGRRVDAAMNASGEPGKIILDYLIKEQKPFSVYLQSSNTGTETTGEWRHRIGGEYKQLLNMDDTLRLEYTTSEPEKYQSAFGAYEFALDKPDYLKARVYGSYGQYSAEDIGLSLQRFEGENLTAGASITWTPLYWLGFPLDLTLGAEWLHVKVDNFSFGSADGSFVMPFVGIGTERRTDEYSIGLNLEVQMSVGGPSQEDLDGLGRILTDGEFFLGKWELAGSAYLDPIFYGMHWQNYGRREVMNAADHAEFQKLGGQAVLGVDEATYFNLEQKAAQKWRRGARVHELAFVTRGQYVLDDKRLSPQLEFIAGGFNTVRGYPESFSAGDNAYIGSVEYRLHIARLFTPYEILDAKNDLQMLRSRKPPAPVAKVKGKGKKSPAPTPEPPLHLASADDRKRSFNFRAPVVGAEPDWDLIFRVFADGAQTYNNDLQIATEVDRTLLSVGAGLELQIFKPLYMTFRLDYGMALADETELLLKPVNAGDTRIHISGTIAW